MRILITGALGTLGAPLGVELRARGHEVWGCGLQHSPDSLYMRADVAEYREIEQVFKVARPDLVYHLAAEFGRHNGEHFYESLWRTAMIGTRHILELCHDYGCRLAFASSSEVYGEAEADLLDEGLPERQVILHPNDYALSKWANERQILSYVKRNPEVEAMRLRFFNAYGPGEEPHPYRSVVAMFCYKALRDEMLPVFKGYHRTFMHIYDFTPTLATVAEAFAPGMAINIGGRDYRSVEDLAEIVITEAGAGGIELVGEDRHNTRSKRPDISMAESLLGHNPQITLEWGIPNTIAWMRERMFVEKRRSSQSRRRVARSH